ncbi:hypothetical protein A4X09_0g2163 [Tilletia walkeri]|uniref:Man1/Src1-like C-terminal domain-containing protein n=1 Tax=Tilletia walkeri TaxID=117179 RepID=A0A8X7NBF5_9BASI|nr:hypothetical protein A4X09_0g2163 [Tilletia walkeri]
MVATRRTAAGKSAATTSSPQPQQKSTPTRRKTAAVPRKSTATPAKIEFADQHSNDDDDDDEQVAASPAPRPARRRVAAAKKEPESPPVEDLPRQPRKQQARQSAAATALSIGQTRELLRTGGLSSSPAPAPSPPPLTPPTQEKTATKEKRKATTSKAVVPKKLVRSNSNQPKIDGPSKTLPALKTIIAVSAVSLCLAWIFQTHLTGYSPSSVNSPSLVTTFNGRLPSWLGGPSTSASSDHKTQSPLSKIVSFTTRPLRWITAMANAPRRAPDTHKFLLALQVGDEIRRVTRERRGKMECGLLPYPSEAAVLDVKAWDARIRLHEGGTGGNARKWAKADPPLPLRNVPHWPEPFLIESSDEAASVGLFTTDPQAYESDDFMRYNASSGPGGYIRWDLLQQHYHNIRFADSEEAIKDDLLERIDVAELSCSAAEVEEDGDDDRDENDPRRKDGTQSCFDELWELALTDLQRPGGVLRFPITGYPPSKRTQSPEDEHDDPYASPLLLSTTSVRSLSCSIRLAAVSVILEILPWFALTTLLVALLGWVRRTGRERREEAHFAAQIREEVVGALRERAARSDEERRNVATGAGNADASELLGDLSVGAEEDGQGYLPIAHLRDVLLPAAGSSGRRVSSGIVVDRREQLSPKRAKRVWASVRRQVGSNSNVRTNSRFWKGESMLVWEWVGV